MRAERTPDGGVVLENAHLRATLDAGGAIASLVHRATGREALAEPGNRLELYEDRPVAWDAWDIDPFHLETRADCAPAEGVAGIARGPLRAEVAFERPVGERSRLRQTVRLDAGARRLEVHTARDWHEAHRLLKVAFPLAVARRRGDVRDRVRRRPAPDALLHAATTSPASRSPATASPTSPSTASASRC